MTKKLVICCEREMSHEAVGREARRAATGFARAGVTSGGTVATMLRNDFPFLAATLAADMVEAVATPINWHFTADEVAYILDDSNAQVLIVHADIWREIGPKMPDNVMDGITVVAVETPRDIADAHRVAEADCAVPEGIAAWGEWISAQPEWSGPPPKPQSAMIYTSGTTGRPKGVRRLGPVPVEATRRGRYNAFVEDSRLLLAAPMYHSAPYRAAISTFQVGGDIVLAPRFQAEETLQLIERHEITHSFMVPTMFIRLLKLPVKTRARYDVSSLRHVVHAGSPCPPEVKRAIIEWWGPVVYEYYGGTETGAVTYCTSEEALAHPGTVGRAIQDATIKIFDEDGNECPAGVSGEIYCRLHSYPDFIYQGKPEERRAIEKNGLVTCGDIGYLDEEGYLYISDRKTDMVISGGVNIYPAQIEAAIFAHEEVTDCAVFGIPDPEYGEALVAAVQPEPGARLDVDRLKRFLRGKVAGYMVPRRVLILNELPRDDSGKIFKRKLRDTYGQQS